MTVERIGDLLHLDSRMLLGAARGRRDRKDPMNPTQQLHELGQSLWLDNITRGLLTTAPCAGTSPSLSVTGLTSNPTIFDQAISGAALL